MTAPRELFTLTGPSRIDQLAPIDQRFFGVSWDGDNDEDANSRIHVAINVFEELNRLAPTSGSK